MIVLLNCPVAYSADIDGVFSSSEWDGAVVTKLLDGESNSGVNFGLVHTMYDYENSALFLCFMYKDPSLEQGNTATGISLSVDGSDYFDVISSETASYADSSEHSFDGCISIDKNNGATAEVRVGFKYGLPKEAECSVRFIDSAGVLSNVYSFNVVNDEYTESTVQVITQNEPEETEKEKNVRSEKTTKEKKNSKKTTTKRTSHKTTEKLTEKPTEKEKTQKRNTYERRTKAPETSAVTAVATKITKPEAVTVYYEKEVIVSHVYVTVTEATTVNDTTQLSTAALLQTELSETETKIQSSFSFSEGAKKKAIVGVLAAISFTVIAAAGTRSPKNKTDTDNNPDSH
ncbi:MAG: hypothetical protein IJD78_04450 [Clostridia bacterium]|nr:hypothetical protein [Clostridia bacterium]